LAGAAWGVGSTDGAAVGSGSTGRQAEGRQYSGGIHQAIEAKEGLAITGESRTPASITVQAFFRRYKTLSGMTGTSAIAHEVLNAHRHEEEAAVVAAAGQAPGGVGRVTVATNMAGRGTDIKLPPEVAAAGGLHVIACGMNDSPRIDRQLAGRAARQGDPGTTRLVLSLDDELLTDALGPVALERLLRRYSPTSRDPGDTPRPLPSRLIRLFAAAQRRREARHALDRRHLIDLRTLDLECVIREVFESAVEMGREALALFCVDAEEVARVEAEYRHRDQERLDIQASSGDLHALKERMFSPENPLADREPR